MMGDWSKLQVHTSVEEGHMQLGEYPKYGISHMLLRGKWRRSSVYEPDDHRNS
jgi:hypothetical protein